MERLTSLDAMPNEESVFEGGGGQRHEAQCFDEISHGRTILLVRKRIGGWTTPPIEALAGTDRWVALGGVPTETAFGR